MKKLKILRMETEEYKEAKIDIAIERINAIDYLVLSCPKCKTMFGIPIDVLNSLLVHRKIPEGVV